MEIIKAIIFGFVEGITEWLPISSTGHLIILDNFLKLNNVTEEFKSMFDVVIQLGAIMAVVIIFWNKLWPFAFNKKGKIFKPGAFELWIKILIACIPAAVVGLLFDELFEQLFYNPICVSLALIIVGVLFIIVENTIKVKKKAAVNSLDEITYMQAFIIGIYQLVAAIFPGTSRSGSTILGGLSLNISRPVITEFTFFLAVPVMFGASLLKGLKYFMFLSESGTIISSTEICVLLVASIIAFVTSIIVIKLFIEYIEKHDFKSFAYYRIVLGIIVLLYFFVN